MSLLLELENISAGYDDKVVLEKVNFKVESSDFIGVIGPNGGGKTTLLKVILGLIKPFKGKIAYKQELKTEKQNSIGYLPQVNSIDKQFPISIQEVVLSGLMGKRGLFSGYKKADKQKAEELIDSVGLSDYRFSQIGRLSGGQLQKVFLCRALVSDPKLLILDEPNTYVDNKFEGELYEYLKKINKDIAIIMVSHDVGTIGSYIKSIACVNKTLHHHHSNLITEQQLQAYNCPIQLISHGEVPHTVLKNHI